MNTNNNSVSSLNNNSQTLYFGFNLVKTYQLDGKLFKLNKVGYHLKKRKLYCLDSIGILTAFTGKFALSASHFIREMNFPKYTMNYYKNLLYCDKYGIYLALNKYSRIEILNEHFRLCYAIPFKYNKKSISYIAYNSVTENVITQVRSGTVVWKLSVNSGLLSPYRGHERRITCMEYSPYADVIASASEDLSIKIWSNKGYHISTFKGHAKPVISFAVHLRYSQLLFSGAADGSIKVWSLESFQLFYSTHSLMDSVDWMGPLHSGWMWCGSRNEVQLYAFDICGGGMLGCLGGIVDRFFFAEASDRTRQIVAVSKDSSARVYYENSTGIQQRPVSILLPVAMAGGNGVFCITYSRINDLFYVLVDPQKIWIYTSKTDPSCRIDEWDVKEMQKLGYVESGWKSRNHLEGSRATVCNKDNTISVATCLTTAYSSHGFQFSDFSGKCSALRKDFLLVGLSNGKVLFSDQKLKNRIYLELVAHNRTILDVKMVSKYSQLITLSDTSLVLFQIWSVPELNLLKSVQVGGSLTAYELFGSYLASGFSDGAMMLTYLDPDFEIKDAFQEISSANRTTTRKAENLTYNDRHDGRVLSISSCLEKSVFCSTSVDRTIKIWNLQRSLVTEIRLDETLTSCLLLDTTGDLLIGWKKHIFKILYSKWLPPNNDAAVVMGVQSVSSASTNIFQLSDAVEDPESSLVYEENPSEENVNQKSIRADITLEYYLEPYQLAVKENDLDFQILEGNKSTDGGKDVIEKMHDDYLFKPRVNSYKLKKLMAGEHGSSEESGSDSGDEKKLLKNAETDAEIVTEKEPPEQVEIEKSLKPVPKRKGDLDDNKPIQTLCNELSNYVDSFDDTIKKPPRAIIPPGNCHTTLKNYFGIFPVIADHPVFGQRAFGEILNKENTETGEVICEKKANTESKYVVHQQLVSRVKVFTIQ